MSRTDGIEPRADGIAITARGVDKVFTARGAPIRALAEVDLDVGESEFVALLGPSGCGKSTLLNLIAGFERPSAGRIEVFGEPISAPAPDRAVVFQEASLFPWLTVEGNIAFGPKVQGRRRETWEGFARQLLEVMGLSDFARALPHELSGGMKQRVGIARALVMQPRVLLMDEPFGALDAQTRLAMQELLLDVWERFKKTVLFITHDIDEAVLLADTVYIMSARPGQIRRRLPIDLPRPRGAELLTSVEFNDLRREILHEIRAAIA